MEVQVLAIGKLKTDGLRSTADYYKKLAGRWRPVREREVLVNGKKPKEEADQILRTIQESRQKNPGGTAQIFLLDASAPSYSTTQWRQLWARAENQSVRRIVFCIGGHQGIPEDHPLCHQITGKIGLGAQTLSHELARVVLLEQIYRSLGANQGHPYHRE